MKTNLIAVVLTELLLRGTNPEDIWVRSIHKTFLEKAGITMGALPAWTREQAAHVLARNPHLLGRAEFRVPCSAQANCENIPFPIMNNAMLGE